MAVVIERAHLGDADAIAALLEANHLPLAGFSDHMRTAVVARHDGELIGSAALEVYDDGALLRSVAVSPTHQREGIGAQLTAAAIQLAQELKVPALYLLTTTAAGYFPKFGFEPIARSDVPPLVQTSIEFTLACPASAAVLRKRL